MTRFLARLRRRDDGGAVLEFALVLPALTTFILGIFYVGWAYNCGSEVRHAVELGSRVYIQNANATTSQLTNAVDSHLLNVPANAITLSNSTVAIGTASSQHITYSYTTTAPVPFISAINFTFSGAVDVPVPTP
jgi:Flp pilus assembly protein TadG